MTRMVTEGRRPHATASTDATYRNLFDSFNPDKNGRISPLEVLSKLERSRFRADDPRTGVEPGTADYDGRTPLHLAAAEGQLDVVRYLLTAGADSHPVDRWGGTPLSDAEGNGNSEVAALLRERAEEAASLQHRSDMQEAEAV